MVRQKEKWIVGEPGGPSGPFWSVVSSSGRVIAMQIPDEEIARLIASFPDIIVLLRSAISQYTEGKTQFEQATAKLEILIAEYPQAPK